jgi:hypothetical protein
MFPKIQQYYSDSIRSFLSQLVTRCPGTVDSFDDTCWPRGWNCMSVLGLPDCGACKGRGTTFSPLTTAYAGPNRDGAGGERKSRPPRACAAHLPGLPRAPHAAARPQSHSITPEDY